MTQRLSGGAQGLPGGGGQEAGLSSWWSLEAQLGAVLLTLPPKYSHLVSIIASVTALDRPAIKSLAKL